MALTRLDNLISSKTGKYLYVSPDDFNATDELNNRGNSPVRPFKSIQRAFIEIARYSYLPGTDNDRFDQFTIMLMPGKHYIDNRPGILSPDGIDAFAFDQALSEWTDNSNLDIGDPDNCLYKFNNTEGGAIIPRGSSMIGYDLRRTSLHPLFVPDPADRLEKRSAIFNVTGGCYFWQMTIRDGDLEPSSPLYDTTEGVGKVYNQTPAPGTNDWGSDKLEIPNFSHHKLTVFEYADKEELGLYYRKIAKAFSQYQPNIDNPNEFGDRIQETRIVGPLSDIRSIESIKLDDSTTIAGLPPSTTQVEVTTKVNHGYFKNQFIAIENNALDDEVNGTFSIDEIDQTDPRVFRYRIQGVVSSLGTTTSLIAGTTYEVNSTPVALGQNAAVKAEVDSVESASPYVFNCSIRSTWGICGIWANGLKATGFKSMVIAQYTGVSLQKDDRAFIRYDEYTNTFNQASLKDAFATVAYHTKGDAFWKDDWRNFHVRASDDSFIQCVSIFAVGFADHFLMESGGDMSITNSNSNFGNTSLHAKGYKGYAFNQDKGGYIDAIIPPGIVPETSGNTKKQSYYTLDIQASNDQSNHTKLYLGDDDAYNPTKRPAATIGGFRIGAKSDEKIFVKLTPNNAGDPNEFSATVSPNGFQKYTATPGILNPTGVTVNNKDLDAANLIEANRDFIAYEAYGYITSKYPALLVKGGIDIVKCRRDIGYLLDATVQDLRLGGNINTIQAAESYYVQSGGNSNLSYIDGEKAETLEGYDYARDLAVASLRNFSYYRKGVETTAGNAIIKVGDSTGIVPGMLVADYTPSDFTDNELSAGATSPNAVIPANTFVKRIVDSTTIELGQQATSTVKQVFSNRHGNARELILANKTFIATEAYERMLLDFPNYTPSTGYTTVTGKAKCIDDLEKAIDAISENTGYGGNADTWDAAYYYDSGSVTDLAAKKDETIRAFNYCKDMAIQVMRKENVFIYGTHGLTQSSVTATDPITSMDGELVNDRNGDAKNLILANKNLIAHESVERMVLTSSTQQFTPTGAVYTSSTGQLVVTMTGHGLTPADSFTVSSASYIPSTGVITVTIANHGFANGEKIKFEDNSLTFTCSMDSGATNHTYPRASDPVSKKWLEISNVTTNTFDVNVGKSPVVSYSPTASTYDPATGLMTLTVGNHGLSAGTNVRITPESLAFTCVEDSNATTKYYPRTTDPFYNKGFAVESVTADTITVQVLSTIPSTNTTAHTFVGVSDKLTATNAAYTASTGALVITSAAHGLSNGDRVKIANSSITMTCALDGNTSQKTYPRSSDPVSNSWVEISNVTTDSFQVNVGASPLLQYTPSNIDYNPITGIMEMTIGTHNHAIGDSIKIADNSLTFTCAQDNHATNHTYPRSSDPISDIAVDIIAVSATTITVQVLSANIPSLNTFAHTFVSAAANAVSTGGDYAHTFVSASANGITRAIVATGGDYAHTFVSAVGQGLKRAIDQVRFDYGAFLFTCDMDSNASNHAYPRIGDPAANSVLPISAATSDTVTIDVGKTINVSHDVSWADYDPNTGDMVLTIGSHNLKRGTSIRLADDSLSFKCAKDNFVSTKTYPRAGTDPFAGTSIEIKDVGASYHTATGADYNADNGIIEITVPNHGFANGDKVQIADGGLTFTCAMDSNASEHNYPRETDPSSGNWLTISDVTVNTFIVNVGPAGPNSSYTPTSGSYDAASGELTLTIGTHTLEVGEGIVIDDNSLSFTCTMDGNDSTKTYPRPATNSITATAGTTYNPTTGIVTINSNTHGLNNGDFVKVSDDSLTFSCTHGAGDHSYPRSTDPVSGNWIEVSNVTTNTFDIFVTAAAPSTNVTAHTFVSATANGITVRDNSDDYASSRSLHIVNKTATTVTVNVGNAGNNKYYQPTAATYSQTTGDLELNIGQHGLRAGSNVVLKDNSLSFSCAKDGNTTNHTYPRPGVDPYAGKSLEIKEVGSTSHTATGAVYNPTTGDLTIAVSSHGFAGPQEFTPLVAGTTYNAVTGVLTINIPNHGLQNGEYIRIKDNSLSFTCAKDNHGSTHTYPRATDPASNEELVVSNVTQSTFDVFVNFGSAGNVFDHTCTAIATGSITSGGDYIQVVDESLSFTCALDSDATVHPYPRVGFDHPSGNWLQVRSTTANDFTVNVGKSSNISAHVFSSALPNGIKKQTGIIKVDVGFDADTNNQYAHTFVSAIADAVEFVPQSVHTWVSGTPNCVKHQPSSAHTFKRGSTGGILKQAGTITINVGVAAAADRYAHAFQSATTGAVTSGGGYTHAWVSSATNSVHKVFSIGGSNAYHNQDCVDDVVDLLEAIADNVAYGGNDKTWDAAYSYKTGNHVAGVSKTVTAATYTPVSGVMTLTIGTHSNSIGDRVKIPQNALVFTCAKDSNATNHSYPRATDPIASYDPVITAVSSTTITINVGPANDNTVGAHTFVSASKQIEVGGEGTETNVVFEHAKQMAGQVIRNQKILSIGSHGLPQIYDTTITADTPDAPVDKNGDAYNLILNNADLIAHEAYSRMILTNSGFTPPTGNSQDCRDDIKDFVLEIAHNVGFGGNDRVWDMANLFVTGAHVVGEEEQTIQAFNAARDLMVQIIRNEKVLLTGSHGKTQWYDTTVTTAPQTPQDNKVADAKNLIDANKNFVAEIALGRMLAQYSNYTPAIGYTTDDCLDDIKDVVDVVAHNLAYGGNDRVWDTANMYVSGGHANGHENETVFAFNAVRDLIIQVMTNETVTIGGHTTLTQSIDNTITADTNSPKCPNQRATVQTLISILTSTVSTPSSLQSVDRTQSVTKCETVRSVVNTLSDIVINAISNPESFAGIAKTVSTATYDHATGDLVLTIGSGHSLEVGSFVNIADNSLTFTCTMDGNTSQKTYPRASDPIYGQSVEVQSVTDNTITVNVGLADTSVDYTPTAGTYDPASGHMTLTIGAHSLTPQTAIKLLPDAVTFTCTKDNHATQHTYPRTTDPAHDTAVNIVAATSTTITLDVGVSPADEQHAHTFVSALANSVITGGAYAHTFVSASAGAVQVGGITRTISPGKCEGIRSTINTLFGIVTATVANGSALDSITRNISNGPCQNVASTITTLFGILTNTISTAGYLDTIDKVEIPFGTEFGPSVNAITTTSDSYLWFSWPETGGIPNTGVYTTQYRPTIDSSFSNSAVNAARRDTTYPECVTQATAVRQYFANINTIIQSGLNSVPRTEPASSSNLSTRATLWTIVDPSLQPPVQNNPHKFETGTPIRLVPRPKHGVTVDKRNVRLPNGFETNEKYYIIAPGRATYPKDYATTTSFNGDAQDVLMLASSKENAAAGIYLHSAEVEGIHPDVEIDLYQFTLDDKYDLHQYSCTLVTNGLQTDVAHIFDVPKTNVPEGHPIFFRANEGGVLPKPGGTAASDPNITFQGGGAQNGRIREDKVFYARYVSSKVFKVYRNHSDAINQQQEIEFSSGAGFSVFADKRTSPMRFDPTVDYGPGENYFGKWYLQVEPNSNGAPSTSQEILKRFHDVEYNDASGQSKTNDTWYTRLSDEREATDRIYRFRYVIPKYLKSVRDPLNGFTIKMRKDETRKLMPQKIVLKPQAGNPTTNAKFYNTSDSGQSNEVLGWDAATFANPPGGATSLNLDWQYDPYRKDLTGSGYKYQQYVTTDSKVQVTIQSARYFVDSVSGDTLLELTVFDHGIDPNVPALKNETLVTVKVNAPQGGSFIANTGQPTNGYHQNTKVEWDGNDKGSGYVHAALNVPGTTEWHLILKGISGTLDYSAFEDTRFTQTQLSAVVFADQLADADYGKSLYLKEMIRKGYPEYYYRQLGTPVYTLTPGDTLNDGEGNQYYIDSVKDVGEIDDTFYVFDVEEIQKRIFEQQDGIFYITAVRGNVSPYPTGAGNQDNFRHMKFSQPISKLYPLNYKNDPVWFKQLDPNFVDPPATYSAADNYVHGLVRVNDFKGSITKEAMIDFLATPALSLNSYTGANRLRAQEGNATSGSEDRQIPIAGDSTVVVDQRLYVELRRPSIARAGNHTFEYLGFGPGNYSTGLPIRQEVLLTPIQDFYAQSKKQDGGLVFYTGLNSNGDLYIGNRKIDAITGEEVFLESASLVDSADEDDAIGNLVTTFDTPVTFNQNITVNGGDEGKLPNTFNSPVSINILSTLDSKDYKALTIISSVNPNATPVGEDATLDRSSQQKNLETRGDIVLYKNKIAASIFQFNPRGSLGAAQGYKIQNHVVGTTGSNISPAQSSNAKEYFDPIQIVRYGTQGPTPLPGDMLLKGDSVGSSGSLGWIYANTYEVLDDNTPGSPDAILNMEFDGSSIIRINWKNAKANKNFTPKITSGSRIRITGFSEPAFNGIHDIEASTYNEDNDWIKININVNVGAVDNSNPRLWSDETTATMEYSNTSWKEWGVLGSEAIRTKSSGFSDYRVGINTVARSRNTDAWKTAFVNSSTTPHANLDVVGNAFISGYDINYSSGASTAKPHALLVGTQTPTAPGGSAVFRINTQTERVGINVSDDGTANTELDRNLVVDGTSRFTNDAKFEQDIDVNGGGPSASNTAEIRTSVGEGQFNFLMDTSFVGGHDVNTTGGTRGLLVAGSAKNIEIGNVQTDTQDIQIGNTAAKSWINIGDTADGDGTNAHISRLTLGGAYLSTETDSFTQIDTKSLKIAGDMQLGTRRGLYDTVNLTSTSGTVEFLSGSSATNILKFATNASDITVAGQGGKTTVRNNLIVDSTIRSNGDITLCGGLNNFSFTADRKQAGSKTMMSHDTGILGNNLYNKNVDIIDVLRLTAPTGTVSKSDYNRVDTAGAGNWGDATWSNAISSASLPDLPAGEFYLPLKYSPYYQITTANPAGVPYFAEQDVLLIDTAESGTTHAEFVQIVSLPRINTAPYYIVVKRLPFGTYTTTSTQHADTTDIFKCVVQYDSTWLTAAIDTTSGQKQIDLAQFGGGIDVGDYVILSRDDGTPAGDNVDDEGEIFKLTTVLQAVSKKLRVKKGCDSNSETTVFDVDSVTGDVTIGDGNTDSLLTVNGSLSILGKCGAITGRYPPVDSTLDDFFTLKNRHTDVFKTSVCSGDTVLGSRYGKVFAKGGYFGSTPLVHDGTTTVHSYVHDPQTKQADGPITTVSAAFGTTDYTIAIASNKDSFVKDDLIAIYDGENAIEILRITDDPYTSAGIDYLPTIYNAAYPAGTYPTGGRGQEGTTVQAWNAGAVIVRIHKYDNTTVLLESIPATGRSQVESPNTLPERIRLHLLNADIVPDKLDYTHYLRLETNNGANEWFYPDSIDGNVDSAYGIRLSKSTRYDVTTGQFNANGVHARFFGGGKLTVNDDIVINSGSIRMYGSDGKTLIFNVANDDDHNGDESVRDEETGYMGLFIGGPLQTKGDLIIQHGTCVTNGTCTTDVNARIYSFDGSAELGTKLYVKGQVSAAGSSSAEIFHIDNLGSAGSGSVGPKDFKMYQDSSIDAFGISRYWTRNGGRRYTYVEQSLTGIGQTQAAPLQANNNYLINTASATNIVVYLPEDAETGDMIRFVEVSGNLSYNASLVIRALKINNVATSIQGDGTGTKIQAGAGQMTTSWDSGELVVQTRNASFGLIYVGPSDAAGDPNASSIPSNLRGWWLTEL